MMGKTHVAVGVLVALLVFQPITIAACAATIAGGALGGSAADIDAIKTDHNHDALLGQLIPVGITGAMLLVEHFLGESITSSLQDPNRAAMVAGAAFYFVLLGQRICLRASNLYAFDSDCGSVRCGDIFGLANGGTRLFRGISVASPS